MPRKTIPTRLNEADRKHELDEQLAQLYKKTKKLSILCDVKVYIIAFTPGKTDVFAWPSLTDANDIVRD